MYFKLLQKGQMQLKLDIMLFNPSNQYRIYIKSSHFIINSIVAEEMLSQSKIKSSHLRNSSSTAYFTQTRQIPFRTILKRRNDTISASQLYQDNPNFKQKNSSRQLSHSQILSQKQIETTTPSLGIKDYVKKMGNKLEDRQSSSKIDLIENHKLEDDKVSNKSSRSMISSSHILKKESSLVPKIQKGTIQELQRRVQNLMIQSLGQLKKQKSAIGLGQYFRTQPSLDQLRQKQLQQLINWLKQLNQNESVSGERYDDLNRKIIMIQKLLARESIEADLIQGAYFNWKIQRGNTTSFINKQILKQSKNYNKFRESQQKCLQKQAIKSRQIVSKYDSTNSNSFKKPPRQYYILSKQKKCSYSANRQPLPRSSYSAQYLNYGQFSTYSYKPEDSRLPETSLAIKASTYQQEYKQKLGLTNKIDFKDLDCYKDKFQNPRISFMSSSKKQFGAKMQFKKKNDLSRRQLKQNVDAACIKKSQQSLLGYMNMSSSNFFKSEHQKQYLWSNHGLTQSSQDLTLKSQIKDKRLDKLKQSFRALAMKR